MNAALINFIYLLSLFCWIGSIIFFSCFVDPIVFKNLKPEKAGELVGIIFPYYYMVGYVCGTLIFVVLLSIEIAGLKWFAWSIMIGQFVSRFVGGLRTWQLLIALLIIPSIPIALWFSVLFEVYEQGLDISGFINGVPKITDSQSL